MSEWKAIDTAPKGEMILVFGGEWKGEINGPSKSGIALVQCDGESFQECGGDYYSSWIENPTHWMPLPKPPISE